MSDVNGNFDFKKYDVGGAGATANDGKLTGEEAQKARADGWTIWDGFSADSEAPKNVNQQDNSNSPQGGSLADKLGNKKLPQWAFDLISRHGSDSGSKTKPYNPSDTISSVIEMLKKVGTKKTFAELKAMIEENGVMVNGNSVDDIIADLTGKNEDKLTAEQKEARAEMNSKKSSIGISYADAKAKIAEILQKYSNCYDEVENSNEAPSDEKGEVNLTYRKPTKTKVFNPDKLPEPAKTEYKEAMASMQEIENANPALSQKGGIKVTQIKNETTKSSPFANFDKTSFEGIGFKPAPKPEPTETQKSARAKLNEKVSSKGISYKDAKATIENITKQYENNPDYQSNFTQEQSGTRTSVHYSVKAFDPYKLKGANREVYFNALSAIKEIETANYALLTQAGLKLTKEPEIVKSDKYT